MGTSSKPSVKSSTMPMKTEVPNEVLLDFLSNPVAEKSSSVKATINVYRPFIWIFMLEVLSLFTAYLFATQPIIREVKDRFKLDRLQESDLLSVGVLVGLSLSSLDW